MVLRTRSRQVALVFRIICIITVSLVYLIVAALSTVGSKSAENPLIDKANIRHLLAVEDTDQDFQISSNILEDKINGTEPRNCTPAAIREFPSDGLTREQRQHGLVLVHVILVCYLFAFLAVVCDECFVPCIKKLCESLHMSEDIAGATFMATASSSAEIFINGIGTFITQNDIGIGTIMGSAVFNILAVPACCGFFADMVLDLEWYPITRDSLVYGCAVILLMAFLRDGKIFWYEALTLFLLYIVYIFVMIFNERIKYCFNKIRSKVRKSGYYREIMSENRPLLLHSNGKIYANGVERILNSSLTLKDIEDSEKSFNVWRWPSGESKKRQCWWVFSWPIAFILYITTPTTRNHPKLYLVTFAMCVFWIGFISYLIAWLITIIGDTLEIPDSVLGLTFLAAGTSVPEAVSSVIVTNQGHGSMGISSSIGSNTFDILLCLGIPWFVKSAFYPKVPGQHWITINSRGINYSAGCLLTTLVLLYISMCFNKFKLDWKIGLTCLLMYGGFLAFATLVELNVFFPVNLPTCGE